MQFSFGALSHVTRADPAGTGGNAWGRWSAALLSLLDKASEWVTSRCMAHCSSSLITCVGRWDDRFLHFDDDLTLVSQSVSHSSSITSSIYSWESLSEWPGWLLWSPGRTKLRCPDTLEEHSSLESRTPRWCQPLHYRLHSHVPVSWMWKGSVTHHFIIKETNQKHAECHLKNYKNDRQLRRGKEVSWRFFTSIQFSSSIVSWSLLLVWLCLCFSPIGNFI